MLDWLRRYWAVLLTGGCALALGYFAAIFWILGDLDQLDLDRPPSDSAGWMVVPLGLSIGAVLAFGLCLWSWKRRTRPRRA